jgi:hypothetical protein
MDDPNYTALRAILDDAYRQCASGKGAERHATSLPWVEQPIFQIANSKGNAFLAGQADKKIGEALRMMQSGKAVAAYHELLGAIVYTAALAQQARDYFVESQVSKDVKSFVDTGVHFDGDYNQ